MYGVRNGLRWMPPDRWQPHPNGPNLAGYLLGAVALGIFAIVMFGIFLRNDSQVAQYRQDCAGFTWTGGGNSVCSVEQASAEYEPPFRSSSAGLSLSSAKWPEEYVELPQGFDWGSRPRDFECQIQRWRDKVALVRLGSEVIRTDGDPEQQSPTFILVSAMVLAASAIFVGILAARAIKRYEKHEAELYAKTGQDE